LDQKHFYQEVAGHIDLKLPFVIDKNWQRTRDTHS